MVILFTTKLFDSAYIMAIPIPTCLGFYLLSTEHPIMVMIKPLYQPNSTKC